MARTYNQDCPLANALDILGERWTFLIVRELLLGAQRFGDLQSSLPGIGANLLSKRLKELEEAGIVEPSGPGGYALSAFGAELRQSMHALMSWSIRYFMARRDASPGRNAIYSNNLLPDSVALAVELFADHHGDDTLNYVAHLKIDDYPYTVYYMNNQMIVRRGADAPATASLSADVDTFMKGFRAELTREEATARMTINGDERAIEHLLDCIVHDRKKIIAMENGESEKETACDTA